jgi:iron complex outermembrane receptor protein
MKRIFLASTCMMAAAAVPQIVLAQDDDPQAEGAISQPAQTNEDAGALSAGAPAAAEGSGIQDIVVTAQRREENLQRAAVAISAVTGDALREAGVTRPTELTAVVPSLQVATAAGPYNVFYLRGVGNFNANAFSDAGIAFNFDGVYIGRPSGSTGFFYDLERVEVVKGPQGTLYGRNATGGAINVISRKPDLGTFGVVASAEYGNYDALRLDAAVNLPLGDIAAVRLAGIHVRHDGYMNDGTDDQDDLGGRASLRVDATPDLRLDIVADYFRQRGQGPGATPLLAPQGVPTPTTFSLDDRIGIFSPAGEALYTSQRAGPFGRNFYPFPAGYQPFQKNEAWGVAGTLNWDNSLGTVTLIAAHREIGLNYLSYTPAFQVLEENRTKQNSAELRFATTEDFPLRAIIGAFYFNEKTRGEPGAYSSNWNGQFDSDLKLDTESEAIFGRLTYAITPEVRLTVGARQTWEDKSFSGTRISLTRVCFAPSCPNAPPLPFQPLPPALGTFPSVVVPGPPFGPAPYGGFPDVVAAPNLAQIAVIVNNNEQRDFRKFTWRAGADWDITSHNLLYASFETGFKSGGFFFSPGRNSYEPETIEAFTLGSKNRFLDNRLQVNIELFHWRYKDQQISHLINIGGIPTFATENVGRATFKGFEIETELRPAANTTLSADVQYLDAEYNNFEFLQANQSGIANPAIFNGTGCPTTGFDAATNNSFVVDCSGRRPVNAPKWTVNLGAQQRIPVSFGEIVLDARAHYQSTTLIGLEFVPIEYQEGFWLTDAAATYYAPDRQYFIGAFVNNIFDETVASHMFPTPGTNLFPATLRPPRSYGIRAGFEF